MLSNFTKTVLLLNALAFLFMLSACSEKSNTVASSAPSDPWFKAPPTMDRNAELIPPADYSLVPAERLVEAEEFMGGDMITQLSPSEIDYFAQRKVDLPLASRPFLIRAIYRSVPEFTVRILDNAFWVTSHDDPNDRSAVRHQPLILVAEEVPVTVYATLGQ